MFTTADHALPSDTAEFVRKMTQALCRVSEPELIVLFGSHARGSANVHSDIDLLVVQPRAVWQSPRRMDEVMRLRNAMPSGVVPVDLLLVTPIEFDRWKTTTNHVIADAVTNGVLLYERN